MNTTMSKKDWRILIALFVAIAAMLAALVFGAIQEKWAVYTAPACAAVCLGGFVYVFRQIFNK